jgi:hypothetical protein
MSVQNLATTADGIVSKQHINNTMDNHPLSGGDYPLVENNPTAMMITQSIQATKMKASCFL